MYTDVSQLVGAAGAAAIERTIFGGGAQLTETPYYVVRLGSFLVSAVGKNYTFSYAFLVLI